MRRLIKGEDLWNAQADQSLRHLRKEFFEALQEWKQADQDFRSNDPLLSEGALERRRGANAKLGLIKRLIKEKMAQN